MIQSGCHFIALFFSWLCLCQIVHAQSSSPSSGGCTTTPSSGLPTLDCRSISPCDVRAFCTQSRFSSGQLINLIQQNGCVTPASCIEVSGGTRKQTIVGLMQRGYIAKIPPNACREFACSAGLISCALGNLGPIGAFCAVTSEGFAEVPDGPTSRIRQHVAVSIECEGGKLTKASLMAKDCQMGLEPPNGGLVSMAARQIGCNASISAAGEISMLVAGAPPDDTAVVFNTIKTRSCSAIYAKLRAKFACDANNNPLFLAQPDIESSFFPSFQWSVSGQSGKIFERVVAQADISNLWECSGGYVRGGRR